MHIHSYVVVYINMYILVLHQYMDVEIIFSPDNLNEQWTAIRNQESYDNTYCIKSQFELTTLLYFNHS